MTADNEIYFEFYNLGNQTKVSAIDGKTGLEVCAIAPVGASEREMKSVAMAKLKRRLTARTKTNSQNNEESHSQTQPRNVSKRGIVV